MWFIKEKRKVKYLPMDEKLITLKIDGVEKKLIDLDFETSMSECDGLNITYLTSMKKEQLSNLKIFYDNKEVNYNIRTISESRSSTGEYYFRSEITNLNYYDEVNNISYNYYNISYNFYNIIKNEYRIIPRKIQDARKEENMSCFLNKMGVTKEEFLNFLNKK